MSAAPKVSSHSAKIEPTGVLPRLRCMQASHMSELRAQIARAQRGDHVAFDALAAARVDGLFRAARLILRDPDGAEDATQEALVRAWRDLPSLRDPERFDGWLHRLLVRACYDEGRRRRRWRVEVQVVSIEPSAYDPAISRLPDSDEIEHAFRHLSDAHRIVLTLQHILGLSTAQVADALGIPEGTVKSRTHYALAALRSAVAAEARRGAPLRPAEGLG